MSTVAMRWPPFSGRALTWSWKKSWCGSYFCAPHEQLTQPEQVLQGPSPLP